MRVRAITAIAAVLASLLTVGLIAGPAAADPARSPGPGPSLIKIGPDARASIQSDNLACIGSLAPEPQYSGTNKTLHWGGRIDCNRVAALTFEGWLYQVVGAGDNERYVQEDHIPTQFATTQSKGWGHYIGCLSTASTRWISKIYGTADGKQFTPVYGWSSVITLPCS